MKANFDFCVGEVLKYEGGYVDDPHDPGGPTNHGITRCTWEGWVGHVVSSGSFKDLKESDVKPLYKAKYWDVCRCDNLPAGVDFVVFDTAVNSGPTKAAKILQQCLNMPVDGIIGMHTIEAAWAYDPVKLVHRYCDARIAYLKSLASYKFFGDGWDDRIAQLRESSDKMA